MGEEARMFDDGNPRGLLDLARDNQVDILIAGGRNMYTAIKARLPFLDVNQERERQLMPVIKGMVTLARQLVAPRKIQCGTPCAIPPLEDHDPGRRLMAEIVHRNKPCPSVR